jgi:sarcosine oxidase, subunit gamma
MPDLSAARSQPQFDAGPTLAPLPPAARYILRGGGPVRAAAEKAAGVGLPTQACRASAQEDRAALWLGPDEWLLIAPAAQGGALAGSLATALAGLPHSLVDVSHRQSAAELRGPQAARLLGAGCPLDLDASAFPVGMCTRTVLAKAEVVLWRTAAEVFRIEVARSFVAYVSEFLAEAERASSPVQELGSRSQLETFS